MLQNEREKGSVGIIALVLVLGGVGLKVVSDKMAENNRLADTVLRDRQSLAAKTSNVGALDYFSSLLQYHNGHPVVYASDYFANNWNLTTAPGVGAGNWSLVAPNLVRIRLPDIDRADYTRVHDPNNFVEPPLRNTDLEILSIETSSAVPFVKKTRMFVRSSTGFNDRRSASESVVNKSVVGVLNLPSPPQPTISFFTDDLTASQHIGSGTYTEITQPTLDVASMTAGTSTLNIDIVVNGIASDGYYVFGGQQFPLNLSNSKNHLAQTTAGQVEIIVADNVVQAGSCSWNSMSEDFFSGMTDQELQEFAEWESIAQSRQAQEAQKKLSDAETQLVKEKTELEDAAADLVESYEDVTGTPKTELNKLSSILAKLVKSSSAEQADDRASEASSLQPSVISALKIQLDDLAEKVEDEGAGEDDLIAMEKLHTDVKKQIQYAIAHGTDFAKAFKRVEDAEKLVKEVGTDTSVQVSTQNYSLPTGAVFNLEVFVTDVDNNIIQRSLTVNVNTAPSDCRCADVGMTSYIGQSAASITGDGGDICIASADIMTSDVYAVFGRKPQCVQQLLQHGRQACGCFGSETKIAMADGTERLITEIKSGDLLLNPVTKKPVRVLHTVQGPETLPMLRIHTKDRSILVTSKHPFPTQRGYQPAYRLRVGDILLSEARKEAIAKIDIVPAGDKPPVVWNIMLAGDENPQNRMLLADGLVTGDLFVQNQLEKERKRNEWEIGDARFTDAFPPASNAAQDVPR